MISLRRFSKLWEFAICPIIIAAVNDYTTNCCSVTVNPFCSGVYYYIGSPFQWLAQIPTGSKSVINDQREIIVLCKRDEFFKIRNVEAGIANRFEKNRFRVFINMRHKAFHIITIGKTNINTKAFERYFKLVVRASIEVAGAYKIIANRQYII